MFHHMMNHMTSMVGMMGGHTRHGMPAGGDMANSMGMITRGPALAEEHGPFLGRGMGEQTGNDRTVANGPRSGEGGAHAGHGGAAAARVPGYPQDMMDMQMYSREETRKLNKPETRGMRKDWYRGSEGLMTIVRVLPPELNDKVVSGKGEVPDGASVPGTAGGKGHEHHKH
jgi:hypothetical protein